MKNRHSEGYKQFFEKGECSVSLLELERIEVHRLIDKEGKK